ncbi:MAG TPA: GNAT family N-acetyltransferase [Steroidobacteraceae bacterium]
MPAGVEVNGCTLRRARLADVPALQSLIATSARALSQQDYTPQQIEGALRGAFGVDTQLIRDGSYFVIEAGDRLAACGGWSRRRTLFGSDSRADRDATELDPAVDAAKIRAFFIHPDFARRGLGTRLLERCERDAVSHGFTRLELMATLPGVRLYAARGYQGAPHVDWPLGEGLSIRFLPMTKPAPPAPYRVERATVDDAADILALQKLAYRSEARLYEDPNLPPLTQTLDSLRAEFEASRVLKAVEGNSIVGSVRARLLNGTCAVGRLIVSPALQGRGLGTRLMRAVEAEFPALDRFELFTGSRSEANIRLYERLGYRRSREQVLTPAVTLVYLEKRR